MWIRKIRREGTEALVTIPRDVMRAWDRRHIRHVVWELHDDHLTVRPLPYEELIAHPAGEEETL